MPYDENVIPIGDRSMRWFEDALCRSGLGSRALVRCVLRQCWRDIHNSGETPAQDEATPRTP